MPANLPKNRFFAILRELISQDKAYLADTKDESPKLEVAPDVKRIGWREGDVVFLSMEVCFTAVVQYCKAQGELFPVKKRTLIAQIAQQNLVVQTQGESARNAIKKTIQGKTHSVLPVPASLLEGE
jgi:hypothetical protein